MNRGMVATKIQEARALFEHASTQDWRLPQNMLMVSPEHFRIDYAINPYMKDDSGQLKVVDHDRALRQWQDLKRTFESLGVHVDVLPGAAELPDMVFAANQSLVFWQDNAPHVLMSRMQSPLRRAEVEHFETWYRARGYKIHHLETPDIAMEGNGDALLDPKYRLIWGGTGPRTHPLAYRELSARFDLPVIALPLKCNDFYHLDTCFAILGPDAVALQRRAFDDDTFHIIKARFSTVIEIDYEENIKCFAGNCHVPKGSDVVVQRGPKKFLNDLKQSSFKIHEVDTSEFMKSGGSVFCMKMMVF